jgi:type II secretory pathway pseudopilin PulG
MTAKHPNERFSNPAEVVATLAPFAEGPQLPRLVAGLTGASPRFPTQGFSKTDTMVAKSAESDTRVGRTPMGWHIPKPLPPESRRKIWRSVTAVATLAAVAAIGWLAIQATARRESVQEALEARQNALQVAALAANGEILKEINLRFGILQRLATDNTLRQRMAQINRSPGDESLWTPLEDWLGARRADHDRDAPADSWFINDVRGTQVARSPRSDASRGENYSHRDYFHGQGVDLTETTQNLKPIEKPHLSAVYRSTSSGHSKKSCPPGTRSC